MTKRFKRTGGRPTRREHAAPKRPSAAEIERGFQALKRYQQTDSREARFDAAMQDAESEQRRRLAGYGEHGAKGLEARLNHAEEGRRLRVMGLSRALKKHEAER